MLKCCRICYGWFCSFMLPCCVNCKNTREQTTVILVSQHPICGRTKSSFFVIIVCTLVAGGRQDGLCFSDSLLFTLWISVISDDMIWVLLANKSPSVSLCVCSSLILTELLVIFQSYFWADNNNTAFQFGLNTWELCFCRRRTRPLAIPTFDLSFMF